MPKPVDDPPPLTDAVIQAAFPEAWSKGVRYFERARVTQVKVAPTAVVARVQGTRATPYRTEVAWSHTGRGWQLDSQCTCPMVFDCKHVVAAALAWQEALAAEADPDSPRASTAPPVAARRLDPIALAARPNPWAPLGEALARAEGAAPIAPASAAGPEESLRFLLDVDAAAGTLWVCVGWTRRLKSGGWGKPRAVNLGPYSTLSSLGNMAPGDLALALSLDNTRSRTSEGLLWFSLKRTDAPFFDALLATGRCHWRRPNARVLMPGPVLPMSVDWAVDAEGTQRLTALLPDGAIALLPDWAYYVAPERGEVGPIKTDISVMSRRRLAAMPPLHPEHRASAEAVLQGLRETLDVPMPRPIRIEAASEVSVRPRLTLEAHVGYAGMKRSNAQTLPLGCNAVLEFDYAGRRVDPDEPSKVLRWLDGDLVRTVARDPAAEERAIALLRREGFVGANAYSWQPQSRDWHRAARLTNAERTREWIDTFATRASAAGFTLEAGPGFPGLPSEDIGVPELELVADGEDWFEARLGLVVEDERIDLLPILLAAASDMARLRHDGLRLQLPSGRSVRLSPERLGPMLDLIEELERRGDTLGAPRMRLAGLEPAPDWRFRADAKLEAFRARLGEFSGLAALDPPEGFGATLRPYQQLGLAWLDFLARYGFGGVLADDMGLGKTVQWLAWFARDLVARSDRRPALIVCPTSVGPNWMAEIARWLPGVRATLLERGDRRATLEELASFDLVITSYALLIRDIEALLAFDWRAVVFDEAQWLKNRDTKGWQAASRLRADIRLAMSGTPVENHLGELKAAFDLVMPGLLGDDRQFAQRFRQRIERDRDAGAEAALRRRIRPFLLRRTKTEVASDLPPRSVLVHRIEFDGPQRDLYETLRAQMEKRVRDALAERGLARSRITVLDALLKLRQVCCDPDLLPVTTRKRKLPSAKREALRELLPPLIEDGRKVLVFSQFTQMLDRIETDLKATGVGYVRLDGRTRNRASPVERFQRGEVPVFLISLKAGGVGLNLTAADTVVLYDPWWNPAVEAQAIDRAHRIGQDKPVFVYELQCVGTVEEKMAALKARKRGIAEAVLAEGDAALSRLGADDLLDLFAAGGT